MLYVVSQLAARCELGGKKVIKQTLIDGVEILIALGFIKSFVDILFISPNDLIVNCWRLAVDDGEQLGYCGRSFVPNVLLDPTTPEYVGVFHVDGITGSFFSSIALVYVTAMNADLWLSHRWGRKASERLFKLASTKYPVKHEGIESRSEEDPASTRFLLDEVMNVCGRLMWLTHINLTAIKEKRVIAYARRELPKFSVMLLHVKFNQLIKAILDEEACFVE